VDKEISGETTVRQVPRSPGLKIKNDTVQRVFDSGTNIEGKRPDLLAKVVRQATGKTVNQILAETKGTLFVGLRWFMDHIDNP
jgi:hypothetical protein